MKIKVPGYIVCIEQEWDKEQPIKFSFYPFKPTLIDGTFVVREETIEIEIPDSFDPTPQKIAKIEEDMANKRRIFAHEMMDLERKLQQLQALPNEVK